MRHIKTSLFSLFILLNLTIPAQANWVNSLELATYESDLYTIDYPLECSVVPKSKGFGKTYFVPAPDSEKLDGLTYRVLAINFSSNLRDYSQAIASEFKRKNINGTLEYSTLDNESATKFVYDTIEDNSPTKTIRIYTIKNGCVFDLQFSSSSDRPNDLSLFAERIIKTFRIKKQLP